MDCPFSITTSCLCTCRFDASNFRLVGISVSLLCSAQLSTPAPEPHQQDAVFQGSWTRQAEYGWCQQRKRMLVFPLGLFKPSFKALHKSVVLLSSCLPQRQNTWGPVVPNSSECWAEINLREHGWWFLCWACSGSFCHRGLLCQTHFCAQLKSHTPWRKADFKSLMEKVCFWRENFSGL